MRMAVNKKTKKEENQAIQKIKNQHANYKWIKYMFARMDELIVKLEKLEETVTFISGELQKLQELQKGEKYEKTSTKTSEKKS
jgi:hypothetical protein